MYVCSLTDHAVACTSRSRGREPPKSFLAHAGLVTGVADGKFPRGNAVSHLIPGTSALFGESRAACYIWKKGNYSGFLTVNCLQYPVRQ